MVKEIKPWDYKSNKLKYAIDFMNDRINRLMTVFAFIFIFYFLFKYGLWNNTVEVLFFIVLIIVLFLMQGRHIRSWIRRIKGK